MDKVRLSLEHLVTLNEEVNKLVLPAPNPAFLFNKLEHLCYTRGFDISGDHNSIINIDILFEQVKPEIVKYLNKQSGDVIFVLCYGVNLIPNGFRFYIRYAVERKE